LDITENQLAYQKSQLLLYCDANLKFATYFPITLILILVQIIQHHDMQQDRTFSWQCSWRFQSSGTRWHVDWYI